MSHDATHNDSNGVSPGGYRRYEEEEISLLDILVVFARKRRLILMSVAACFVLGLAIALTSASEYAAEATVVREMEDGAGGTNLGGGLSALQGLGVNFGGSSSGLTTEAFPDILQSREVRLAVVRDTFYVRELGRSMTFLEYANRESGLGSTIKDYTVGLPFTLLRALRERGEVPAGDATQETRFLSEEEEQALRSVSDLLSTSIDQENGLMTISITTQDPMLSAGIAESFANHLVDRVRTMRTQKARQNLEFIEERFEEAQEELQEIEEDMARFLDRNRNIGTAQLENERDRLQRQVSFAEQLYSEIQTQRTQAELELQRNEPVITVLEEPVPSLRPSGPRRTLIVLLSIILGGFIGVGAAFVATAIENSEEDEEERGKLDEIRAAFSPRVLLRRFSGDDDAARTHPEEASPSDT